MAIFDAKSEQLTDKQVRRLLASTGKWFFVKHFEEVYSRRGNKRALIYDLYREGYDKDISGTTTRVSCMIRLMNNGYAGDALEIIANSSRMYNDHPELTTLLRQIYAAHPALEKPRGVR